MQLNRPGDSPVCHLNIHLNGVLVFIIVKLGVNEPALLRFLKQWKPISFEYLDVLHGVAV